MERCDEGSDSEALLDALRLIAERAGKVILAHYVEVESVEVRAKADSSPVTDADEASEVFILEALAKLTPDVPVVSEEAAAAGEAPEIGGDRFWLVDPLDGTKEFLSRNGEFTVNIALIEGGTPVAGVVHAPAMAMTWAGARLAGDPAIATYAETDRPRTAIRVRPLPEAGATVVVSRRHGDEERLSSFLKSFKIETRVSAGSSLKFCLIAAGRADLYPRFGRTMEWDTAAGQAVLEAAGGRVTTTDDRPLAYGKAGFENPPFVAYGGA